MQERLAVVRYDDGAQLTDSQKVPGDYSALTRREEDGARRLGQVTFRDPTEDDLVGILPPGGYHYDPRDEQRAEAARLRAELIVAAGTKLTQWAAPHVKRWLREQVLPAAQQRMKQMRNRGNVGDPVELSVVSTVEPVPDAEAVIAVPPGDPVEMSSAEAQARIAALVIARLFYEQQERLLNNARITDEDGKLDGIGKTQLPTVEQVQQLADALRPQLEASPSLRLDDLLGQIPELLDRAVIVARGEPGGCKGDARRHAAVTGTSSP